MSPSGVCGGKNGAKIQGLFGLIFTSSPEPILQMNAYVAPNLQHGLTSCCTAAPSVAYPLQDHKGLESILADIGQMVKNAGRIPNGIFSITPELLIQSIGIW